MKSKVIHYNILKWILAVNDHTEPCLRVPLPKGSKFLTMQQQGPCDSISFWFQCPEQPNLGTEFLDANSTLTRQTAPALPVVTIRLFATCASVSSEWTYLGTAQLRNGARVVHAYMLNTTDIQP